ncbi:MAG: HepT-like ribonuclease domain-containing protein [Verrucomicrobiales bacterium]
MSKRDPALLLEDMRAALEKIARYTAGMQRAAFLADEKTVDAVVRNLEIIGEASKQVPEEFKALHPALPWSQMAGLRNRIVHDYAGIDLELIWDIVGNSLPALRGQLDGLA